MKKRFTFFNSLKSSALMLGLFMLLLPGVGITQTNNYFGTSGTLSGNVWSTNPAGPYTSALVTTGGAIINFDNTVSAITGGSITVAGINATANVPTMSPGGTISNLSNGVIPVNVSAGITLDFGSQSMTSSGTGGYIKNGPGTFAMAGNTFGGGFTLNAGTFIVRGTQAFGSGVVNLNGGTVAANANRAISNPTGIVIGGDVQFGEVPANIALASGTATISFSDNASLGSTLRTLTLGNSGSYTFSGVISNTASTGITFAANADGSAGSFILTGANTYTGTTTVTGGTVQLNRSGGTTIPTTSDVVVNGGIFRVSSNQTLNNLTVDGGTIVVDNGVTLTVTGTLTLTSGYITLGTTGNGNVVAANIAGGSSASYVVISGSGTGALIRNVASGTTPTVFFPIGITATYRPATVTYTSPTTAAGTLSSRFVASAPTSTGLPLLNEQGVPSIDLVSPSGYWSIVSSPVLGGAYTMTVDATDFLKQDNATPITDLTGVRLIKRPTGGSWALSGSTTTSNPSSLASVSADGLVGFSDFGIAGPSASLPVELVNFEAKLENRKVLAQWSTFSEKDNAYFNVQHATDGINFKTIGKVIGNGTTNEKQFYSFEHTTPSIGTNYYRLQQVDLDSKFAYSDVRSVVFGKTGSVLLFPAPTAETLNIQLDETFATDAQWQIIDMAGRVLSTGTFASEQQSFQIPVGTLVEGAYVLRIVADQQVLTQQFKKK